MTHKIFGEDIQKNATQEDVNKIVNHVVDLTNLDILGFYETRLFTYKREAVPNGILREVNPNEMRLRNV